MGLAVEPLGELLDFELDCVDLNTMSDRRRGKRTKTGRRGGTRARNASSIGVARSKGCRERIQKAFRHYTTTVQPDLRNTRCCCANVTVMIST